MRMVSPFSLICIESWSQIESRCCLVIYVVSVRTFSTVTTFGVVQLVNARHAIIMAMNTTAIAHPNFFPCFIFRPPS
jgi:hypothetical protein